MLFHSKCFYCAGELKQNICMFSIRLDRHDRHDRHDDKRNIVKTRSIRKDLRQNFEKCVIIDLDSKDTLSNRCCSKKISKNLLNYYNSYSKLWWLWVITSV